MNKGTQVLAVVGRFSGVGGYATVARTLERKLSSLGIAYLSIDIESARVVSNPFGLNVDANASTLEILDPGIFLNVIVVDRPDNFPRVRAKGNLNVTCHTIFEFQSMPDNWVVKAISADLLAVPTQRTLDFFLGRGVSPAFACVLPHFLSLDDDSYRQIRGRKFSPEEKSSMGASPMDNILFIPLSDFTRRDFKGFLRALADLKRVKGLPIFVLAKATRENFGEVEELLVESGIGKSAFKVESRDLSDSDMVQLIAKSDFVFSADLAPGWDLTLMEALACGTKSISFESAGSGHLIIDRTAQYRIPMSGEWSSVPHAQFASHYSDCSLRMPSQADFEGDLGSFLSGGEFGAGNLLLENSEQVLTLFGDSSSESQLTTLKSRLGLIPRESHLKASISVVPKKGRAESAKTVARGMRRKFGHLVHYFKSVQERTKSLKVRPLRILFLRLTMKYGLPRTKLEPSDHSIELAKVASTVPTLVQPSKFDARKLQELKLTQEGRIFVLGNGPSLNSLNLEKLEAETVFGCNNFHLAYPRFDWRPRYYSFLDWRAGGDLSNKLDMLLDSTLFVPTRLRPFIDIRYWGKVTWFTPSEFGQSAETQFDVELARGVPSRASILVSNIQLAAFMGFKEIVLLGLDASYTIPQSVRQSGGDRFGNGVELFLESTEDDDPNHFDPKYFGKGARWHDPNVPQMLRDFYTLSKWADFHQVKLINGNPSSNMPFFPFTEPNRLIDGLAREVTD